MATWKKLEKNVNVYLLVYIAILKIVSKNCLRKNGIVRHDLNDLAVIESDLYFVDRVILDKERLFVVNVLTVAYDDLARQAADNVLCGNVSAKS